MTLTPVVVGTLTADPFDLAETVLPGNVLPFDVNVETVGESVAGGDGFHPMLTATPVGVVTGTPV